MSLRALIWCPACHRQHVDEGEWVTREHKTHRCVGEGGCGFEWRPMDTATVGVAHLDGLQVEQLDTRAGFVVLVGVE